MHWRDESVDSYLQGLSEWPVKLDWKGTPRLSCLGVSESGKTAENNGTEVQTK